METLNNTAAIVVTYNRRELLRKCVEKILAQENACCDVLVVNNASSDGTEEMILSEFNMPRVKYFNTGSNLGSAGGFQYGVEKAVRMGYEYLWIMDDDVWPDLTALSELEKADRELHGNWGFLSSIAYWQSDGSLCKANIQKKALFTFVNEKDYEQEYIPVLIASFASLYIKAEVVKKVGLPVAEYFIYTDDYEYTSRISKYYKGYVVSSSTVQHAMKENKKADFAVEEKERIYRYDYLYRNDVHCYRQYGIYGWLYIILKDCYTCINILKNSKADKLGKIKVVAKGFKEGLGFHPQIRMVE